uniref:Putative glutaredoxin family protein n=1 Tax=Tanacetum cinerariifolium TaxID=118510 RepID=A0A699IZD7_TANCI|nr:putative glutaredoxin family protein [Tanacetum cinerariifolium]
MEKNVPILEESDNCLLLAEFEEKCPPEGNDSVIYTTSLRGIRKTFENCNTIRFLLGSFQVLYDERDVSIHMEFREELWRTLGSRVIPPRLFINGRLIGGVEEVVGLHEEGKLARRSLGSNLSGSGREASDTLEFLPSWDSID